MCPAEGLEEFVRGIVRAMGADDEVSREVAGHLVRANLVGHDSHGVLRVPQYIRDAENGQLAPAARPTMLRELPGTALLDARRSFGHFSTLVALEWAMAHAREQGIAAVAVRHSHHIGRLGEYAERAGQRGQVALLTVGMAGPGMGLMIPHGGRRRFLGANPWAIGVPAQQQPPMVFDASTSAVAEGKVRLARAKGVSLPPGCIIDRDGTPSTNPDDFYNGGALLSFGGEVGGHKAYGLAMASALIGGLAMIGDDDPSFMGADAGGHGRIGGVFLVVIDPAAFGPLEDYAAQTGETLTAAKQEPPASGHAEVLLPGEPEVRTRQQRERDGIPLPEATWRDLGVASARYGVPLPTLLA